VLPIFMFVAALIPGLSLSQQPLIEWSPPGWEDEALLLEEKAAEIEILAIERAEQERLEAERRAAEEAAQRAEEERQAAAEAERQREQEEAAQAQQAAPPPAPAVGDTVWDRLAECESGNWINGGTSFERGSARWYWARPGTQVPPWGTTIHHGGLQFHPGTWTAYRLDGYPQFAYDATREQQIAVGERVLAAQGWGAWPTCARKLGLR
jgi:hypothetical protein